MRGIRPRSSPAGTSLRFIPADAGNTACKTAARNGNTVHPRGCGEYVLHHESHGGRAGSSPRMRGILYLPLRRQRLRRFIPADAGNTPNSWVVTRSWSVHPRGCGEYIKYWSLIKPFIRFIPADAGNTCVYVVCHCSLTVHPRGCGEYRLPLLLVPSHHGSSPRMRGIRLHPFRFVRPLRFIPADAGNTAQHGGGSRPVSVHPRGCGEYQRRHDQPGFRVGSSPRMRGILTNPSLPRADLRFIPADAGNTAYMQGINIADAVHPRGCGEYARKGRMVAGGAGSSPRMRGIPLIDAIASARGRFIPADAGNT